MPLFGSAKKVVPVDGTAAGSVDNQAAIAISYNPELHSRTKHIDRRHFFIRECVENMQIVVPFVASADKQEGQTNNLADFLFTKPLPPKQFFAMRDRNGKGM